LNSDGGFFDLQEDPLERRDLRGSTQADIVAARGKLGRVLNSFPPDADAPFDGYRGTQRKKRK
jgi:hypothetical protein